MATFSFFTDFTTPTSKMNIIELGKALKNGTYKDPIEHYRNVKASGDKDRADDLKKKLFAFTPSGVFHTRRIADNLEMYSGYIGLDYDKIPIELLESIKLIINASPYTTLCFISPSGDGLKVFVEVNTGQDFHSIAYQQVKDHFDNLTDLAADEKCKDITRLCFVSYDPDTFRNIGSTKFEVSHESIPKVIPLQKVKLLEAALPPAIDLDLDMKFQQTISFTNNKLSYHEGNRNNYIYALASNCNRNGINQMDCIALCKENFDLAHKEIEASVTSSYKNHFAEHATFKLNSKKQSLKGQFQEINTIDQEDFLKSTPTIPIDVFETLPDILRAGCSVFDDPRRRDVFLFSALSILSGCLPGVSGIYSGERIYPHLFTFVIAPAASGKGVLKNAKRLADKYHERILKASRDAQANFDAESEDYKNQCRNLKKGDASPEKPMQPKFKILFIPADSSSARMIEHLQNNGGEGIICETEADTMSGAKKQDWGDYSPVLRSAFHHEKITQSRKTNNEYIEIKDPKLAVCISGTPAQAPRLISSSEDGLFSRFLFYAYKNELVWIDPSSSHVDLNDFFDDLSSKVLDGVDFLSSEPSEFVLSPAQWASLNKSFAAYLREVAIFNGDDAAALVFRLGLIAFRIAMIFAALRKAENAESRSSITCSDRDFDTVMILCNTFLQHSLLMYNNLPNQSNTEPYKNESKTKQDFISSLPSSFSRAEAVELGKNYSLSPRSVDSILRNGIGAYFEKVKAGQYNKIEKS